MRSRLVGSIVLAALVVSCGDSPTEVVPERSSPVAPSVAFATTTTEDGLSISTDKDDYQPGDTVHFTGTGWQPGDSLDIVLVDDPMTHESHTWAVGIAEDGTFHDSTYVVDTGDLGVTFTLTATSRATGRSLTVIFTDGNIGNVSFSFFPGGSTTGTPPNDCTGSSGVSVAVGTQICAKASFTITAPPNNATAVSIRWLNPSGAVADIDVRSAFPSSVTGAQTFAGVFTPTVAGIWTALLCESGSTSTSGGGANGCTGGPERGRATFIVRAITFTSFTFFPGGATSGSPPSGCTGSSGTSVTAGTQICARADFTVSGTNGTPVSIRWRNPSGTVVDVDARSPDFPNGTTGAQTFAAVFTPTVTGTWTALLCESSSASTSGGDAAGCPGSTERGSATFTVTAAPMQLAFSTAPFTVVVGECSPLVTVQTQTSGGTPTNPASNVTVDLSTTSTNAGFFSDAACTTPLAGDQITIFNTGNSASFHYRDFKFGSPVLTAADAAVSNPLQSATQTETVNQAATSLTLELTPNTGSTYFGQNVTLEATIAVTAPGSGTPTGNVEFFKVASAATACGDAGNVLLGSDAIDSGTLEASFSTTSLAVGTYIIKACYAEAEDPNYAASASNAVNHEVKKAVTETLLADSPASTEFGETVTFTAIVTVKAGFGAGTPAGSVTFKTGVTGGDCTTGAALTGVTPSATNPATLNGSGVAVFTVNSLPVGNPTVTACYGGNASFEASSDDEQHAVTAATTTTVVSVTPASQQYSDKVNLKAVVTPYQILTEELSGDVHFFVGVAAVSCSPLPAGEVGVDAITAADDGVAEFLYSIDKAAGSYVVTGCFVSSKAEFASSDDTDGLTVTKEDATLAYDASNPVWQQVSSPGGTLASIALKVDVNETNPELNSDLSLVAPGDINQANVTMSLVPVAGGSTLSGACSAPSAPSGYSTRNWQCSFTNIPVNLYAVAVNVTGNYYTGTPLEEVFTVYDPSLGFTTGGGTFRWPGTYEKTNFGFVIKYNKKGSNPQGSLLIIRHLPDGTHYRAKTNALEGLSIVGTTASFSGKSTYTNTLGETTGGNLFYAYVEDNGTSGTGVDEFSLYLPGLGTLSTAASLGSLSSNAQVLTGGNIVVPHTTSASR